MKYIYQLFFLSEENLRHSERDLCRGARFFFWGGGGDSTDAGYTEGMHVHVIAPQQSMSYRSCVALVCT